MNPVLSAYRLGHLLTIKSNILSLACEIHTFEIVTVLIPIGYSFACNYISRIVWDKLFAPWTLPPFQPSSDSCSIYGHRYLSSLVFSRFVWIVIYQLCPSMSGPEFGQLCTTIDQLTIQVYQCVYSLYWIALPLTFKLILSLFWQNCFSKRCLT